VCHHAALGYPYSDVDTQGPGGGTDEAAEREALSRAREGKQDKRDAKVMAEDKKRK